MRPSSPRPLRRRLSSLFIRHVLPPAAALVVASALAAPAGAISWSVDSSLLVAIESSIVLDGAGDVHLAFRPSSGSILYEERVGGFGSTETVDGGSGRSSPRIALDGSGTPNVVYRTSTTLYFAKRFSETQWGGFVNNSSPDVITTGLHAFLSGQPSFALDPSGNPHVLYYVPSVLRHAWHDGGGWHDESVIAAPNGIPAAITFDASGTLHAAFSIGTVPNQLLYKIKNGSGWQPSEVVFAGYGATPSIAISSSGQPRIAFTQIAAVRSLRYVARETSGWGTAVVIDNTSDVGANPCLALDSGDLARITYWDRANWDVRAAWQCGDGTWDLATVDAAPNVPAPGSEPGPAWLGLRSNGEAVVYYSDFAQQRVKNATGTTPVPPISTLAAGFGVSTSITSFTLPTDCATLLAWEVRVAGSAITSEAAWNAASTFATGFDATQGTTHCISQTSLPSCTYYYFAAKYTNRYGVLSGLSNSAGGKTRCTGSIEVACDGSFARHETPEDDASDAPLSFALFVRGANPASDAVGLGYVVPSSGVGAPMRLDVFDVSGRLVRSLGSGTATAGLHEASWNLRDEAGRAAPRGLYFVRCVLGHDVMTRRVVVSR